MLKFGLNVCRIILFLICLIIPFLLNASEDEGDLEIDVPLTVVDIDDSYNDIFFHVGDTIVSQYEYEEFVSPYDVINFAYSFLGTPHVWGTKGPHSFDCSGFTSYVYKYFGFPITSASKYQINEGVEVKNDDIRPGDLMFFGGRSNPKTVGHVGMCVEVNKTTKQIKFIHASTKRGVVVNTYPDDNYYYKRFLCARRIITEKSLMEDIDVMP